MSTSHIILLFAINGQEHPEDLTIQHRDLKRRQKELSRQHDYLKNGGRNMPPCVIPETKH